jgi:hypothetical protein
LWKVLITFEVIASEKGARISDAEYRMSFSNLLVFKLEGVVEKLRLL